MQREVMWNLQRANVVTIVRPGDAPVPYKRQGNPAVNTPQGVRLRQALRKAPLIQVIHGNRVQMPPSVGRSFHQVHSHSAVIISSISWCITATHIAILDGRTTISLNRDQRYAYTYHRHHATQEISNEYWCFPGLNPDGSSEMSKESYIQLNRKLHLALVSLTRRRPLPAYVSHVLIHFG